MSCTFRRKGGPKSRPQPGLGFQERERGFEPPTSSLGSNAGCDGTGAITALTETLAAACTAACTRMRDELQVDPLDLLADELRVALPPADRERLAGLLKGDNA